MRPEDFTEASPGELVLVSATDSARGLAYLPAALPPDIPIDASIWMLAEEAAFALGNLNGLGHRIPNPMLLARPFIRSEAIASSRIEGTRAEYSQLVLFEADENADSGDADLQEVNNQIRALTLAWSDAGLIPALSVSGIASMHRELLRGVRGDASDPGDYRTRYVMIGSPGDTLASARFVPCPPDDIRHRLDNLLEYILNDNRSIPMLARLAISHYQFEVIHPFNDGNGRIGRMLIPLTLREWGLLDAPLLYLSEYLERNRDRYIDSLHRVSTHGDWTGWIEFFLIALREQSADAVNRSHALLDFRETLRAQYQTGRRARALPIIDALFERPTITYAQAIDHTGLSQPSANALVKSLVDDQILIEATGRKRNQVFYAPEIARVSMGVAADDKPPGSDEGGALPHRHDLYT